MLTIRRYTAADREAVTGLHTAALAAAGSFAARGPWDADIDDIEGAYFPRGDFLVGHAGGVLVAMGALRPPAADSVALAAADEALPGGPAAELKRMRVHPDHQGRGYGDAILVALLARCGELGYERAVLDTTAKSTAAIGLYRKHGFRLTGFTTIFEMRCLLFAREIGQTGTVSSAG
jgi:ribosomal protein S18 acetylase RimI-like enzyme